MNEQDQIICNGWPTSTLWLRSWKIACNINSFIRSDEFHLAFTNSMCRGPAPNKNPCSGSLALRLRRNQSTGVITRDSESHQVRGLTCIGVTENFLLTGCVNIPFREFSRWVCPVYSSLRAPVYVLGCHAPLRSWDRSSLLAVVKRTVHTSLYGTSLSHSWSSYDLGRFRMCYLRFSSQRMTASIQLNISIESWDCICLYIPRDVRHVPTQIQRPDSILSFWTRLVKDYRPLI